MYWRKLYRRRKMEAKLLHFFTHHHEKNIEQYGFTPVTTGMHRIVFFTEKDPTEVLKWVQENIPSMSDNSWYLEDKHECSNHGHPINGTHVTVCCE